MTFFLKKKTWKETQPPAKELGVIRRKHTKVIPKEWEVEALLTSGDWKVGRESATMLL